MASHHLLAITALLSLLSATTLASNLPWNKPFKVPKNVLGPIAKIPDPPARPIKGPGPAEPKIPLEIVYRCWGYLGKPEAVGWIKMFFYNGTLPGEAVCRGVLNVHKDCWPDMYKIWWFTNLKRINHLGHHCRTLIWKLDGLPSEQKE